MLALLLLLAQPIGLRQAQERARAANPGAGALAFIRLYADPAATVRIRFGDGQWVYVDPCSGRVAGKQALYGGMFGANSPFGGGGMGGGREVDRLLDQNFKRVKMLLEEHREAVIAVAEALIEKHALMGDEVYDLVARAEARTNGHANGHVQAPPPNAPAFEIAAGGQPAGVLRRL